MPGLSERARATRWTDLPPAARAYRVFHAAWSIAGLAAFGHVWRCAVTGHRDRILWASIGFLALEGAGLVVGRGDCPMGEVQERMGDPVPFFELVLPPRAAKAAVPILAAGSVAGMAVVAARIALGTARGVRRDRPGGG
jgi:hypothetical protein